MQAASEAGYGFNKNNSFAKGGNLEQFSDPNNYGWTFDPATGAPSVRIKSGEKQGTTVKYSKQGDQWVPEYDSASNNFWDTNRQIRNAAKGVGTVAAGVLGGVVAAGAGLGAGAGAEAVGAGAEGLTALGEGAIAPLSSASTIAEPATGLFGSSGSWWDTAKDAYDIYGKAKKGFNLYDQFTQSPNTSRAPAQSGAQSGTPDWMSMITGGNGNTGLLDLWGAIEGSRQTKDYSGNMKNLYDQAQARRQPVLDKLNESYTNPNSFYDSNQWKGLESVYQNSIDRKAGQAGRLANPTDREVLLQQHAMKGLEDYRKGLRDEVTTLSPDNYINPITRGYELESRANNPYGALGGRGSVGGPGMQGGGGSLGSLLTSAYGGAQQIPAAVRNLFPDLFGGGEISEPLRVLGEGAVGGISDAGTGLGNFDFLNDFSDWWA